MWGSTYGVGLEIGARAPGPPNWDICARLLEREVGNVGFFFLLDRRVVGSRKDDFF